MPSSTLKVMSLVMVVASALVILLGLLDYFRDGKMSSNIPVGFVLLFLGILYLILGRRRPPDK